MPRTPLLTVALSIALGSACSDDSAVAKFCGELAEASCQWARSCCELDELGNVLGLPEQDSYKVELLRKAQNDQNKCKDLMHSTCVAQQRTLLESLRSKRVTLNQDRFGQCLQELEHAASSCDIGLRTGPTIARACDLTQIFSGNAAKGDACFHALDCGNGTFCWRAGSGSGPGICRDLVAKDEPCRETTKCQDNRVCAPVETRASWCAPVDLQAAGEFCTDDSLCGPGLFCDGSSLTCRAQGAGGAECNLAKHCLSGRCRKDDRQCEPQREQGEPCSSDQQCADKSWCNPVYAARLCSVPLETGKAGDLCTSEKPCSDGLECVSGSCRAPLEDGSVCSSSALCGAEAQCDSQTHVCTSPRRSSGESCTISRDCLPELYCHGTCMPRVAAGESCTTSSVCAVGNRCDEVSRTCEALLPEGRVCNTAQDCVSGLICEQFAGQCGERLANNALCDRSGACPVTQYCGPTKSVHVCEGVATVKEGETCAPPTVECATGLFCDTRGSCRAKGQVDDPCTSSAHCSTGLYCTALAVCRAMAGSGDTCSTSTGGTEPICGPDLTCQYDVSTGYTCVPLPGEGESCYLRQCITGTYCTSDNQCEPLLTTGEGCTSSEMCASGLFCDPEAGKCTARKAAGEGCEGADQCADDLRCHSYSGKCADRTFNEAKACTRGDQCAAGLQCELESRCTPLAQENEICDDNLPCAEGLRCEAEWGVCVALDGPFAAGEKCLDNDECTSGLCVNHVCTGACQGVGR